MSSSAPETAPTLGVLVSNYRTWDLTRRCLEQVAKVDGDGVDTVLVVDDASNDDGPSRPEPSGSAALPEGFRLLINDHNLGLPATLNRGLEEIGTDVVVVFDSDAYPLGAFAGAVRRAFADDPRLGVLGFATVDADGRPTGSWEREPGVLSLVLGQRLYRAYLRLIDRWPPRRVTVYSCAMAVRRDAVLAVGGFDEALDWLDLDHELCIRLDRAGWTVARTDAIRAFHEGAGAPQEVSQRVLRFYKTRWRLLRKFDKIRHPRLVRALILGRLHLELWTLRLFGRLLITDPARRRDTIEGRERVIDYCRTEYR